MSLVMMTTTTNCMQRPLMPRPRQNRSNKLRKLIFTIQVTSSLIDALDYNRDYFYRVFIVKHTLNLVKHRTHLS